MSHDQTLPIDLSWRRSGGDVWPESDSDGRQRRAGISHAGAPAIRFAHQVRRASRETESADDDDGARGRVKRFSETAPDPVFAPTRRLIAPLADDSDEETLRPGRPRRLLADDVTIPRRIPRRGGRGEENDDEPWADGWVRRVRARSDAAPDFRLLPRRPGRSSEDDDIDHQADGRVRRPVPKSDEPTPIYALPRPLRPPRWLIDEENDDGRTRPRPYWHLSAPEAARIPGRRLSRLPEDLADPEAGDALAGGRVRHVRPLRAPTAGGDSLALYLSGAASDGGAQTDPHVSLGGYRSATEATRVGILTQSPIQTLTILAASRENGGSGQIGSIQADGLAGARYTAPGNGGTPTPGPNVVLDVAGVPRTLPDGHDPSKWVRVQRSAVGVPLIGVTALEFHDQFGNLFALRDAANAESSGGGNRYRACIIRAREAIRSLRAAIGTLGPQAVSSAGRLPAGSTTGTIVCPDYALESWPTKGWARIETAGGTLREIVYYLQRGHNSLFVLSLGRGRLGTTPSQGAFDDVIFPVPGLRIGWEGASPAHNGPVQAIASESTAPAGITWSTAITLGAGVAIGDLATERQGALWIHRELPVLATGHAALENRIVLEWVHENATYRETLAGLYRMAYDLHAQYELHIGTDGPPDITLTPSVVATALPFDTPPLAAGHTYHLVTNRRNKYDLVSESIEPTLVTIAAGGAQGVNPPSPATDLVLGGASGGAVRVSGVYFYAVDASPADQFALYATSNGTDPNPATDTPILVTMVQTDGAAKLDWTSVALPHGTVVKMIVRTRRSSDGSESISSPILTHTVSTTPPAAPANRFYWRQVAEGK